MSIYKKYIRPTNTEIENLIKSDLDIDTKMFFIENSLNNISRKFMKALNSPKRNGKYNSVITDQGEMAITISTGKKECRQFYKGMKGFYTYDILRDKIYKVTSLDTVNSATGNELRPAGTAKGTGFNEITVEQFESEIL